MCLCDLIPVLVLCMMFTSSYDIILGSYLVIKVNMNVKLLHHSIL